MTRRATARIAGWAAVLGHLGLGLTVETYRVVVAWPIAFVVLRLIDLVTGGPPSTAPEIMAAEYAEAARLESLAFAVVVAEFVAGIYLVHLATRSAGKAVTKPG